MKPLEAVERIGIRKVAVVALGVGLGTMALDAGIEHFAGREGIEHLAQLIPVVFGSVAMFVLTSIAFARVSAETLRRLARWVGVSAVVVGTVGMTFHARPLLMMVLADPSTLGAAMYIAPPMFAPGAFTAIGLFLWMVVSPRLVLSVRAKRPALQHA